MNRPVLALFGGALLAGFALAACGGDDDSTKPTDTPAGSATTAATSAAPTGSTAAATAPATTGDLASKIKAIALPEALVSGRKIGSDDAKVKLQVYEDFRCPHCLEFTANYEQHLVDTYVKPGTMQIEFKYFPLSATSLPIMQAAVCADQQGQFWAYNKRLFQAHAESNDATALGEAFGDSKLKSYAAELKLDAAKFEACQAADASLDPVAADYREAQGLGINGTPSFIVNGKRLPNVPASAAAWKTIVDAAAK